MAEPTLVLFDYDGDKGRLTARQTISTLPAGFGGSNFCSEILVSSDGRFVYAGNRLHDSVGIFSIGERGELTHVADEWTRGNYPIASTSIRRGSSSTAATSGDNLAAFRVDRQTGQLKFTGQYTRVGNSSCIVFLDLAMGA